MIRVSVFYPHSPTIKFDMGHYLQKHIPMVKRLFGAALKGMTVEQGLIGVAPGEAMTYAVIAHLSFDSVEAFQSAFAPHAADILADIPNYTNTQPILQISEVKL